MLLPQGTNQSYGALPYSVKMQHYIKENLLVKSLHPNAYENNPNFIAMSENLGIAFKAHESFAKQDIYDRQEIILQISKAIWGKSSQSHAV